MPPLVFLVVFVCPVSSVGWAYVPCTCPQVICRGQVVDVPLGTFHHLFGVSPHRFSTSTGDIGGTVSMDAPSRTGNSCPSYTCVYGSTSVYLNTAARSQSCLWDSVYCTWAGELHCHLQSWLQALFQEWAHI